MSHLHLTYADRAEVHPASGMPFAESLTAKHPEALLAVYDEGEYDLILKSPGRDIDLICYGLRLEWTECDEHFDQNHTFFAVSNDHARAIANSKINAIMLDVDAVLTDDEGEEVHL